jgi:hypothetical protein
MSGLLVVQSVGGSTPDYTLTVQSSAGVVSGDHVVAPRLADATHGAVYRVLSVPDGFTIVVKDDLLPGGGTYGPPTSGRSAYWTSVLGGLSTSKTNSTPFWGDVTERDLLILKGGLNTSIKSGKLIPGNFSGNPKKATVTFATSFPSAQYAPVPSALSDGSKSFSPTPESKTASGFVVNLNANNLAGLIEVGWHAVVIGE